MPESNLLTLAETAALFGISAQEAAIKLQQGKFPQPDLRYLNGKGGRPYYAPRWRRDHVQRLLELEQAAGTAGE
jgi:hypothetical protein